MSGPRVTLADVAARAGVSASTASLAFSRAGPVAESTRSRVLAAAAALGYAGPDPLAQSLRRRRTGVVGVVVGAPLRNAFRDPVAVSLLDGMSEELSRLGSGLLLLPDTGPGGTPPGGPDHPPDHSSDGPSPDGPSDRFAGTRSRLARFPVDVLVFATCGADDDPLIDEAAARAIPMLGIEGPHRQGVPVLDIDQRAGGRAAAEHLCGLGHRRLAVVTLPLHADGRRGSVDAHRHARSPVAVSRERLAGVRELVDLPPDRVQETAANLVEEGERAAAALLAGPAGDRPTAIITQSDLLAIGVVRAAYRMGLRVPADLSVIGFDGIDTSGWLPVARLSTIEQPMARKGRLAGAMVADLLAGRIPASVTLPVRLRPGTTTGPPPAGTPSPGMPSTGESTG